MDTTQTVRAYHERTKHQLDAYAKGPEFLDWDQQPNPFRRFVGTEVVELALEDYPPSPALPPQGVKGAKTVGDIAALLELSLGLSAWKQYGPDRWALRCNPSSGNLHPTEGYVIANGIDGLGDGVYHYAPHEHALELRGKLADSDSSSQLLLGLSSIAWREAWKYGERAFRYVQLDVGHALGAVRYAAAALGLQVEPLPVTDTEIAALLGLDRADDFTDAETEHPDMLLRIHTGSTAPFHLPTVTQWHGKANALGGFPQHNWPIIEEITTATASLRRGVLHTPSSGIREPQSDLIPLIRQRRSAQAFSGKTSTMSRDTFYAMLSTLLPATNPIPWDVWTLPIRLHPILFVHRVEGLPAGLYALPRHEEAATELRSAMNPDFGWQTPEGCPDNLPLFHLLEADTRKAVRTLSCHQDIASTSSFSLGMLAEFDAGLAEGAPVYRHLYWEAGLIGQVLYLQAEAAGVRGTGIGCFFDDSVHEVLGLQDTQFQSLYHFTVGSPAIDTRLEMLPPYSHLPEERQP